MKKFLILIFLLSLVCGTSFPQGNFVDDNYDKAEYQVPMRDGVKLLTIVYTPKDNTGTYPILMQRTPYSAGPYGSRKKKSLSANKQLEKDMYIFVFQDVRGKYMSEGDFVNMRPVREVYTSEKDTDETTDTYDTVEWLLKHIKNNNGRVGMCGVSYPGFYAVMGAIHAHPAMKCVSPQAPISDWFLWDDMHHNGAFTFAMCFNFFQSFGQPRPEPSPDGGQRLSYNSGDAYNFFLDVGPVKNLDENYLKGEIEFWNEIIMHPDYDEFWQARSTLPHLKNITPAVLTVGGWYDGEDLSGALHTYKTIEENNPGLANMLVMGPWIHGGWGYPEYNRPSMIPFRERDKNFFLREIEYPFFSYYLKGEGTPAFPDTWVFETGTDEWRSYESWPPAGLEKVDIFLDDNSVLQYSPPSDDGEGYDEYVSDPAKPVPYTALFLSARGFYNREYLSEDQRFAATRPDVLVYKGEELKDDLTLSGPVEVELYVSTTGTDSDWVVKLIDVYPDTASNRGLDHYQVKVGGYQMLVRGDIFRGKYRNSFENPEPFIPGEPALIKFRLPDINHCFRKGHRLMVQVQSSWFPLFDMNPQTFTNIYKCSEEDFRKANQRVYHSPRYPTKLSVLRNNLQDQ